MVGVGKGVYEWGKGWSERLGCGIMSKMVKRKLDLDIPRIGGIYF